MLSQDFNEKNLDRFGDGNGFDAEITNSHLLLEKEMDEGGKKKKRNDDDVTEEDDDKKTV